MFAGPQRGSSFLSTLSWRLGFEVEFLRKYVDQDDTLLQSCLHGHREETPEDSVGGAANGCARHTQCGGLMSPVIRMLGEITLFYAGS